MAGGSYSGTVQWLAARERPPHLACILPKAAAGRWFDETPYLGGAFLLGFALTWSNLTAGRVAQDANAALTDWDAVYRHRPLRSADSAMGRRSPVYQSWLAHPTFDWFWQRITLGDRDFARIALPALTVTGWFDADQSGALHYWRGMRARSPARNDQFLVIGPWQHVATIYGSSPLKLGELEFSAESAVDVDRQDLEWFDSCLKGTGPYPGPRARLYLTGVNRWENFDDYPPATSRPRKLFLHSGGHANTDRGDGILDWSEPDGEPPDEYRYDPRSPIPIAEVQEDGVDQRHLQGRDDILVYTSAPLTDTLTVIGNVSLTLYASSDGRDTDFMAKIMDVDPQGRARKLGAKTVGVIRARFREGYDRERLLVPGRPERFRIELFDLGHVFLPGHRIQIDVSSSASPAVAPNPNTGNPIATDTAWRVARQRIYHDRARPSHLLLPVVATP
jgi:putative CocE/NonD family hydrolase